MLLKFLDVREAVEVGEALADSFISRMAASGASLDKFLEHVVREAAPLRLGIFRKAKLANSFKWRLLEKGVDREIADEVTGALVVRLSSKQRGAGNSVPVAAGRSARSQAQALLSEGDQYMRRDAPAEAAECYRKLLSLDPRHAVACNNLGAALCKLGHYREAVELFRRAIGIRPNYADAHGNLGAVLRVRGRHVESEASLRRALKLKPAHREAQLGLASTLILLGQLRDAGSLLDKVLKVSSRNAAALVGLGNIAGLEGRFAEAEALHRRALEVNPTTPAAWSALAGLRRMTPNDRAWLKGAEAALASGLPASEEATLLFSMGKYYDDLGDYARAFRSCRRANELHRAAAEPYDREARRQVVDALIRAYTREAITQTRAGASDSERPVFVVGMPRSGTTLIAQIIHSHAAAKSAGELRFWADVVYKHAAKIGQGPPDEPLTRKLASAYLDVLAGRFPDALRVVDKTPFNSDYLGLVHSVFPKAHIIYVRRDPIDACLSCYFQPFSPELNFTMDLTDLAHYYREHHRLVAHWRSLLPQETLLEVPYAELIADQEKWTRRILDFLGLEWDERCLRFHETERAVLTASYWQVRQRLFHSSLGRWRHYEKFIGPLLELQDQGPA